MCGLGACVQALLRVLSWCGAVQVGACHTCCTWQGHLRAGEDVCVCLGGSGSHKCVWRGAVCRQGVDEFVSQETGWVDRGWRGYVYTGWRSPVWGFDGQLQMLGACVSAAQGLQLVWRSLAGCETVCSSVAVTSSGKLTGRSGLLTVSKQVGGALWYQVLCTWAHLRRKCGLTKTRFSIQGGEA